MDRDSLNSQSFSEMNNVLFEQLTIGVMYQDMTGRILAANSAVREILGLSSASIPDDVIQGSNFHAIHEDGSVFDSQDLPGRQALRTGKTIRDVIIGLHKPDAPNIIWLNVTSVPLPKTSGNQPAILTTIEDITARKTGENQLRQITRL